MAPLKSTSVIFDDKVIHILDKISEPPNFAKQSSDSNFPCLYADNDPDYPIGSREQVYRSYQRSLISGLDENDMVVRDIKAAAHELDISHYLYKFNKNYQKYASHIEDEEPDGFPVRSKEEARAASKWFAVNRTKIASIHERYKIAKELMDKISKIGEIVPAEIKSSSFSGKPNVQEFKEQIQKRSVRAKSDYIGYRKLASELHIYAAAIDDDLGEKDLKKLAIAIDQLDEVLDVKRYYGPKYKLPEDLLFDASQVELVKNANDMADEILFKKCSGVGPDDLESALGKELFSKVTNFGCLLDRNKFLYELKNSDEHGGNFRQYVSNLASEFHSF
jgi:hypothetical protein